MTKRTPHCGVYCKHVAAAGGVLSFVYYEIYIDQFVVEQILVGCLLFLLTSVVCRQRLSGWRLAVASMIYAAVQCAAVLMGQEWISICGLLISCLLLYRTGKRLAGGVSLLMVSVLFGGTLEVMISIFPLKLCSGVTGAFLLLRFVLKRYQEYHKYTEHEVDIILFWEEKELHLRALVDTGNRLKEPLTGQPVSILSRESAGLLLEEGWEARRGFYMIPYHSIGKEKGWMRGVAADKMYINTDAGQIECRKPVLAISDGAVNLKNRYQVILNPEHLTCCETVSASEEGQKLRFTGEKKSERTAHRNAAGENTERLWSRENRQGGEKL